MSKRSRRRGKHGRRAGHRGAGGADHDNDQQQDDEQPRLSSGQRYTLLVAVLVILGVGVIFIDTILAWVMGLLGRN